MIRRPRSSTLFPYTTLSRSHVAQGTRLLVVRATRLHADGLGDRDLHVGDVVAVPQRLEDLVGEAQHEEVLDGLRSEEHTSELQSRLHLVCRLLLEKKKNTSI